MTCGFYAVNNKHCIINWRCVVCGVDIKKQEAIQRRQEAIQRLIRAGIEVAETTPVNVTIVWR